MIEALTSLGGFVKYHALGNDYLVIDAATFGPLSPKLMQRLCARHHGIGADGVLVRVSPQHGGDVAVRIFNPDGSEAERSGNGLRIFVACMHAAGQLPGPTPKVEVGGVVLTAQLHGSPTSAYDVEVEMGTAQFVSTGLQMAGPARDVSALELSLADGVQEVVGVALGNPHCVCLVDALDPAALRRLGPQIACHPLFAARTNVQLVQPISRRQLDILIWERGAGETQSSGTSSCAAVAAAFRRGLVDHDVVVRAPGGSLQVHIDAEYRLRLRGPVQDVCAGRVAAAVL